MLIPIPIPYSEDRHDDGDYYRKKYNDSKEKVDKFVSKVKGKAVRMHALMIYTAPSTKKENRTVCFTGFQKKTGKYLLFTITQTVVKTEFLLNKNSQKNTSKAYM